MESICPLYSPIEDVQSPEQACESQRISVEQHPLQNGGWDRRSGPSLVTTALSSPSTTSYSPTRTELESHPIRQRLSIQGDEFSTGLGVVIESPFESDSWTTRAATAEQELAQNGDRRKTHTMADSTIKEGDAVSYQWGGDKKGGTVTEVATEGSVEMQTARGNTATKDATPNDPAIRMERAGHDVVKNASEVTKEEAGETHNEGGVQKTVSEAQAGNKRAAEPKENGEEPKKKKGRPAKGGAGSGPKKEHKKRPPKRAATESGEPRRSGRVAKK